MEAVVKGADVMAEIKHVIQEPGRFDENLALARDFVNDVETLVKSMSNLYEEHAARFISVGVTVEVNVNIMHKRVLHSGVGLAPSGEDGLVNADGKEAETEETI